MSRGVLSRIMGIKYRPLLCRELKLFDMDSFDKAFESGSFLLNTGRGNIAVSWWVSSKRTRSYPYARVYDTLSFNGRKVTIVPVFKDEGEGGDRDFLQWDTISLMSLLDVYVIIAYYSSAEVNERYPDKITNQKFDYDYLKQKIEELNRYRSSALHWNLSQIDKIAEISKRAGEAYAQISQKTGVKMHSEKGVEKRIEEIQKGRKSFMEYSRQLAKRAQNSESRTSHAMEKLVGSKGAITIKNYLGGNYYFTVDEMEIKGKTIYLVEGKNTQRNELPALEDIKDGLLKMIIFCNLSDVTVNGRRMIHVPVLKLTAKDGFEIDSLSASQKELLANLKNEAAENNFRIYVNNEFVI